MEGNNQLHDELHGVDGARWHENGNSRAENLPLGWLNERLLRIAPGRELAYVTDAAWKSVNAGRLVELASDAEVLFIEALP